MSDKRKFRALVIQTVERWQYVIVEATSKAEAELFAPDAAEVQGKWDSEVRTETSEVIDFVEET
jgi:hypothetical protein